MRSVYLKTRFRGGVIYTVYKDLINCPPDGYQFVVERPEPAQQPHSMSKLNKNRLLIHKFDKKIKDLPYVREIWHEAKIFPYLTLKRIQSYWNSHEVEADLVYSSQQLTFAKLPWVVDLEFANALVDYGDIRLGRKIVEKALASKYCKKIMPCSEWAERTLYRSANCNSFKEKIETVHLAVKPKDFVKEKKDGKLRLLFVGSINELNFLDFEGKGGFEVVEAFLELNKKYDELELVIRSWVPPEILEKCSKNPNIKILYSPLSDEELAHLYASSDIFMFPAHLSMGMVIREAMSYELPVIARAIYNTTEAIKDMKTGILLSPLPQLLYYLWNGAPNYHDVNLLFGIRKHRPLLVKQIVEKASLLIEDGSLRRRIGREARRLIEEGDFSTKNRNKKLKRIFDEVLKDSQ